MSLAVLDAFQETDFALASVGASIKGESSGFFGLHVLLVEAELRLDGGAVDTVGMEALAGPASQLHILLATMRVDREGNLDVHAGNELGVGKLPDVNVVAGDDTRESLNVLSNVLDTDMLGGGLEQNAGSCTGKRDRGLENNGGNEERDGGIGIELAGPVGEPDDESRGHDTNIAQSITDDVQDHGVHTHIVVVVATLLAGLLGQRMVVAIVHTRVTSWTADGWVRMSRLLVGTERAATLLNALEQWRLFIRLILFGDESGIEFGLALAGGITSGGHARGDNILAETGRVNAHVLDAGQTGVSALAGAAVIATSGKTAGGSTRLIPGVTMVLEADTARFLGGRLVGMQAGATLLLVVCVVV